MQKIKKSFFGVCSSNKYNNELQIRKGFIRQTK